MKDKIYDIAVVGGGAAGMAAAITAARLNADVIVLEKNDIVGKKLLSTGNGRCNFTNRLIGVGQYFSDDKKRLAPLLSAYGTSEAVRFFGELGMISRENKDGGYYPYSNKAKDVRACFDTALRQAGVSVAFSASVRKVVAEDGDFMITVAAMPEGNKAKVRAKSCILATGGMAAPKSGSTGDGYYYAKCFGHTTIEPHPALVGLLCEKKELVKLSGLRARAGVSLLLNGAAVRKEYGEVQFNRDGLSGIPVMSLSRLATDGRNTKKSVEISLDLFPPGLEPDDSPELLMDLFYKKGEGKSILEVLTGLLTEELSLAVLSVSRLKADAAAKDVTDTELFRLHSVMSDMRFPVTGAKGFASAQVTAGGVPLSEVDMITFASLKQNGLYLCGELLDVDGICGGYNLHFAWASGQAAGRAAAKKVKEVHG